MVYGYKGYMLHVNLSQESYKVIKCPENILNKYIGGRSLGAKFYWDLIPPEAGPLEPENVFMALTGPLNGTIAPTASKHLIVTKSPASGGWLESYSSGRVASELKYSGYDALIITGKSKLPINLFIHDDKVDFSVATHLWGKGTFETETYIRKQFDSECGSLSIGPAGEHMLPFACVGSEYYRQAGRGGAGAVMGSKNLKAIAIKGSGGINCVDIGALHRLVLNHQKKVKFRHMTPTTLSVTNAAGMLPTRNFSKGQYKQAVGNIDKDAIINVKVGDRACFSCFSGCSFITQVKDGIYKDLKLEGPEYETLAMLGSNLEIDYLPAIMKANFLCDDLGMDTISAGVVIGFVMECYERGILTDEDTDGLKLNFGNYKVVIDLLELIAQKKGFGAFCAKGVKEMAQELKRKTEEYAMHAKGLELPAYDPRAGWGSSITYSITPRGGCHRRAWPPSVEILGGLNPFSIEGKAEIVKNLMNQRSIMHSLIVCDMIGPRIGLNEDDWANYVNVVVGSKLTGQNLIDRSELTETLIRQINIREGFSSQDDIIPKRILEESLSEGPPAGKIIGTENFLKMRTEYFLSRGWDEEGIPTRETLKNYKYESDLKIII
jgi:aldehyde:ferredoxin oxidoreductase